MASDSTAKAKMPLLAKKGIRDDYEQHVPSLLPQAQRVTGISELQFLPNLDDNFAKLAAYEKTLDRTQPDTDMQLSRTWDKTFGAATLAYFQGFVDKLEFKGFGNDDLMREALADAMPSKTVSLKIVEESLGESCDCIFEDGSLVLRTTVNRWWSSPDNACNTIDRLL